MGVCMGKSVSIGPIVMALGGILLLGLVIHECRVNGDIGLAGALELAVGGLLFIWGVLLLFGKERHATRLGFRMGRGSAAAVLLVLILAGIGAYVVWKGDLSVVPGVRPSAHTTTASEIPLQLPIRFIVRNALTGAAFSPALVLVNDRGYIVETLAVNDGVAATSGLYTSGQTLYLKVVNGTVFYFVPVKVPYYNAEIARIRPPEYHVVTINAPVVPASLGLKVIDVEGNAVTALNVSAPTPLNVMVVNSKANTELPSEFYNPITKSEYGSYVVITVTGSGTVLPRISGAQLAFQAPGKAVYIAALSQLPVRMDPRTGTATPATQSIGITLNPTGVPKGTYKVVITAYTDLDASYLHSYGVVNSDAVPLGSVTLTVGVK